MIEKKDIENLANLSRIKLTDAEKASFQKEIEGILGYISQIKNASGETPKTDDKPAAPQAASVFREDVQTVPSGEYTEALVSAAPARQGDYVKVKNIF